MRYENQDANRAERWREHARTGDLEVTGTITGRFHGTGRPPVREVERHPAGTNHRDPLWLSAYEAELLYEALDTARKHLRVHDIESQETVQELSWMMDRVRLVSGLDL